MNTAMNRPVAENADLRLQLLTINFSQRTLLNGVTQSVTHFCEACCFIVLCCICS